ncbi:endospore germination permease [Salicibibacter cibarius]|uniref:Endospore germination permease n=1 Tax=Salicibibacter cibarius TaxID=2743000 RepID=A0A7T7CAY9_9BACI|nr:endospore germination permease [Salicibibacter cibarius]QQK75229.1 endospore germination permease [Salicibibacter cibarius]
MLEKGKISLRQFSVLVILITVGGSMINAPAFIAAYAKQDAWLVPFIGMGVGLLMAWLYTSLKSMFPDQTLVEYSERILGKWMGKALSLVFILHFFVTSALLLRLGSDFIIVQILMETPLEVIHILFVLIVVMGVGLGIETLARMGELVLPVLFLLILVLFLGNITNIEIRNLQPMLVEGLSPVLKGTLVFTNITFFELVYLMILPRVNRVKGIYPAFAKGILIGGGVLWAGVFSAVSVLGVDATVRSIYPSYTLAKSISIANIIEGIEVFITILWIVTTYFKLALYFYAAVVGLAQTFELRTYRAVLLPLGMILVILAVVISPNEVVFMTLMKSRSWFYYSAVVALLIPLILFFVAKVRKKQDWNG